MIGISSAAQAMTSSAIREILKITQRPEVISFAGGLPAPELFPVEEIRSATDRVLTEQPVAALQYSTTEGHLPLRTWIAERSGISADHVQITSGSQQGLDLLGRVLIDPGDVIAVSDMSGRESFGQIRKIGIRAISVITRDKKEYLIPNENLMINQVENWSYSTRDVRVKVPVSVAYDTDIVLAEELMLRAAKEAPRVLDGAETRVLVRAIGGGSIDFEIRLWIEDPEEGIGGVQSDVLKRVWHLFREHGIEVPFQQRDLYLRDSAQFRQLVDAIARRLDHPQGPSERGS